jgi:hypothetical protein
MLPSGFIFFHGSVPEQFGFQENVVQQLVFVFLVRDRYDVGQAHAFKLL